EADLAEPPEEPRDVRAPIVHEGGLPPLEGVTDELERPPDTEQDNGEGEANDRRADHERPGNERDAHRVAGLVDRVAMVVAVLRHHPGPVFVQTEECHWLLLLQAPIHSWGHSPTPSDGNRVRDASPSPSACARSSSARSFR